MSYILDALRKSEQERQRGQVPDIYNPSEKQASPERKRNIWPLVTAGVVIINLGVVGYLLLGKDKAPSNQPLAVEAANTKPAPKPAPQPPTQSAPSQNPGAPNLSGQNLSGQNLASSSLGSSGQGSQSTTSLRNQPAPTQPVTAARPAQQPSLSQTTASLAPAVTEPSSPVPNVAYMPRLEEISPADRAGIPDMNFSSHMYSSHPRFRSIIINGRRLKEGQFYDSDLQVREITEAGVIMSKGPVLFEVDVLGRWAQ